MVLHIVAWRSFHFALMRAEVAMSLISSGTVSSGGPYRCCPLRQAGHVRIWPRWMTVSCWHRRLAGSLQPAAGSGVRAAGRPLPGPGLVLRPAVPERL